MAFERNAKSFGSCVGLINGVQIFQAKDGYSNTFKRTKIEDKDDAGGTTVLDRYGTGVSASVELEGVNFDKSALEEAYGKVSSPIFADGLGGGPAKDGAMVLDTDGLGQSDYEYAKQIEIYKVRNGITHPYFCFAAPKAFCTLDLALLIGSEKQGQMKVTYNLYPLRVAATIRGVVWPTRSLFWHGSLDANGRV